MLFPRGNAVKVDISQPQFASVYVECPDLDLEEPGWGLLAAFSITLVNQLDPLKDFRKGDLPMICLLTCTLTGSAPCPLPL